MTTIAVTQQNLAEITGGDGIVILDFWATWCGACKAFAPVYEAASDSNPDIVFGKVDVEAAGELAASFGIRGLPTLAIYRDSIMVFLQAGALPRPELNAVIAGVRSLDMDRVRAEVESQPHQLGHVHHQ